MRLVSYEHGSQPALGVRSSEGILPLADLVPELPNNLPALLALGAPTMRRIANALGHASQIKPIPEGAIRLLPPITQAGKILCLGLNYADHAAESKQARPDFPVIFLRANTSLVAHGQAIVRPLQSPALDFEGELVAVVGRTARHVKRDDALDYIAGYSIFNDASIRDYQLRTPQWTVGKNFDASGAFGPDFITSDEIQPGASGLKIETRLNGAVMQSANTRDMIFGVAETVELLSACMTLEAGDVLVMGTPAGVGAARKPPVWMKPGDVVEVMIEKLGTLSNPIVAEEDQARAA
ncbi:fumarylacetoacetate hydrolase family protein [Bradyrhizobium sp. 153]|uniref:fumarylacetoacetate hydrolase family protein n=1 Tax=Bradyrhizobium sp. 153 TaxID=2782627 RepID=UPI001FF816A2|nr:fumarylacetoacetate hydrolase family protein [Bradyrhizobium sp. 153]MCK1667709.1 fumarylacetoacetate hydrolase family protein [Bradyrhizobium sp. 153]